MKPQKRVSKKTGEVSYLLRVNLDYRDGQQIVKSMTWKPDRSMTPKQIEKELTRQQVLFEEQAKQDYKIQLERETDKELQEKYEIEYMQQHTTFRMLAEEWLELITTSKEYKPTTIVTYSGCKDRVYMAFGDCLVTSITYRKVQAFIASLSQDGVNQKTGGGLGIKSQKKHVTFVSDVMLYAKRCGIIEHNPCRDIVFTKTEQAEQKVYSLDEVIEVLFAVNEKAPINYKCFFNLLAFCGLRRAEALGLEFKDIDFDSSTMMLNRTSNYEPGYGLYTDTLKTRKSRRRLKISSHILLDLIRELQAQQKEQAKICGDLWIENDRLFTNSFGKPLHNSLPYKWLEQFCKQEHISFKALHSFRHFVATQANENGVNKKDISDMMGHEETRTTEKFYIHNNFQDNAIALDSIAATLEKALNCKAISKKTA